MRRSKQIQQSVLKRIRRQTNLDAPAQTLIQVPDQKHPHHLHQFLRMAKNRKRQILTRLLMD